MFCHCILLLAFFTQYLSAYPFRSQKAYANVDPPPPDPNGTFIFNTSGVHHYPTTSTNDCLIPGCIYERQQGEPSDPIWPQWWMSNWTMYVGTYNATGTNVPPWDSPPQGIDPSKLQISSGWSSYDSSYNEGDGAMIEHYDKQCLQIFPHPMNWSCSFVSLGAVAYFLRYDDRPSNTPECCIFSNRNYAARRYFVQHLPYNPTESTHLNDTLQAYSMRPGGILFGYAFYRNYTSDSFDSTLLPYRHPHSFYFDGILFPNGFENPPENIYISQNYKDFRAQQPDSSTWDLVNQKCQGELEYCCLFDDDCPGRAISLLKENVCPPITVDEARTQLIEKLTVAAQLEHSLMVAYLYAGASLKARPEEFSGKRKYVQFELVRQWRRLINQIAREEMGHLHYATAILVAVGGLPSFAIPDFPHNLSVYNNTQDLIVSLDTFNINTILNFIRYESSDLFLSLPDNLKQIIRDRIVEDINQDRNSKFGLTTEELQKFQEELKSMNQETSFPSMTEEPQTVGDFYAEIVRLLQCFPTVIGPDTAQIKYPTRKDTHNYNQQTPFEEQDLIQYELLDSNISDPDGFTLSNPDTKRQTFSYVVPNTTVAIQLINEILLEGEGGGMFVNKSDLIMWLEYNRSIKVTDSITHLYRFLSIIGQYQNELKKDPNFIPSRSLVSNPQIPSTCPNGPPDPYALTIPKLAPNVTSLPCPDYTSATIGASLVDIFNRMYNVLCIWLQQGYMHQGPENDIYAAESLMFWLFMSDEIRPTMEILSTLPISANDPRHTSGAFQQYYRIGKYKGIVVIPQMKDLQSDSQILQAFQKMDDVIRQQQRDSLSQISSDLQRIEPFLQSITPLYSNIYHALVYGTRVMVDEYDARVCYGFGEAPTQFHPNMTPIYPPWEPDEQIRDEACPMVDQQPDAVFNSDYEERSECTEFGGDMINGRLLEIKFKGWFQARLATDPDPPNEFNGVTGNTFAYSDEPPMDRALYFQPTIASTGTYFSAPIRYMDNQPLTFGNFGVKVVDIIVHQYPNNNLTSFQPQVLSGLTVDEALTTALQSRLSNCAIDLKSFPNRLPNFKSDNYLMGQALEQAIDPFLLDMSCNGDEMVRRQVAGPALEDMSPGQRQFIGRHSQNFGLVGPNIQTDIGFPVAKLPWRFWRTRIKILQQQLRSLQPIDETNPLQLKLMERILDIYRPMPQQLVDADENILQIITQLDFWNIMIVRNGVCNEVQSFLARLQQQANNALTTALSCNISTNFLCKGYIPPPPQPDPNILSTTAYAFCLNPHGDPTAYENAYRTYYTWVDMIVQNGTVSGWDIRFTRLGMFLAYQHSISGNVTVGKLNQILNYLDYQLNYKNRISIHSNQSCYKGPNDRWGINYDMSFFDTDLLWAWTNGSIWIPIKSLKESVDHVNGVYEPYSFTWSWLFVCVFPVLLRLSACD